MGPEQASLAAARRHAEGLIAGCRTEDDFKKLIGEQEKQGDTKVAITGSLDAVRIQVLKPGDGRGSRRGEITPAELEPVLFKLKDGEIGPIVESAEGVHIVRMIKHHPGGLVPLDDEVRTQIRNRLRYQDFESERQILIRDLRSQATIRIENE